MTDVAAVILAAGRARRFGANEHDSKAVALIDGMPLVRRVAATAVASRAAPVVVVTGHAAAVTALALEGLAVQIVHNACYAQGMARSLAVGLAVLPSTTRGALILLADMPLVTRDTLDALILRFAQEAEPVGAVVPVCGRRRGNPVLLARAMFPAVASLTGDQGARGLLADAGARTIACSVDDPGIFIDIDTKEMLETAKAAYESGSAVRPADRPPRSGRT